MEKRSRHLPKKIAIMVVVFVAVFALAFVGVQFITKTGIFKIPGKVIYDESVSAEEIQDFDRIFNEEVVLDKDVTISVENRLELGELSEHEYLAEVLVPVGDFYTAEEDLVVTSADELMDDTYSSELDFELIPIAQLDDKVRLYTINGKYYLDEFDSGAVFRVIKFDTENIEEIGALVDDYFKSNYPSRDNTLSFIQTGVTALSRGMNEKLASVGDAKFFSKNIGEFLSSYDLTHTSNESSFTNYATSRNICSNPKFIDTLLDIGLDIVELTGNHNQDCGDQAAIDTIDIYEENNIKIVGGGKTADLAKEPLLISEKDNNITMLAFNLSTGGATLDNTPGANQYYEEVAKEQITEAKERGDFVIVDIQYYECAAYASTYEDPTCDAADSAAGDQVGFFRHLIELGADVVIGTSAHQAQTFEIYDDGVIYYGLGNLFFDQVWWPGTTRSLMLAHYFNNGKLLQTRIIPTVYGDDMQTKLLDKEKSKWLIERLISARP